MAAQPPLVVGVADHDLNRPLIDGTVRSADLALEIVWDLDDGVRHRRMQREGTFDACEFSFGTYLQLRAADAPFRGIPVFPNRKFRHSYVFVNRGAGLREPRDLAGKRVGMREWGNTASLWVRGIFQRFYGLDLARVAWVAQRESAGVRLPPGVTVEILDALLVGEAEQGLIPRPLTVEELFIPETLAAPGA